MTQTSDAPEIVEPIQELDFYEEVGEWSYYLYEDAEGTQFLKAYRMVHDGWCDFDGNDIDLEDPEIV